MPFRTTGSIDKIINSSSFTLNLHIYFDPLMSKPHLEHLNTSGYVCITCTTRVRIYLNTKTSRLLKSTLPKGNHRFGRILNNIMLFLAHVRQAKIHYQRLIRTQGAFAVPFI